MSIEAMKQALEEIKIANYNSAAERLEQAITTEESSAVQEPKREWVGLTDDEVVQCQQGSIYHFYRCIEAKLKEKNT